MKMKKYNIFLFILNILLLYSLCKEDDYIDEIIENYEIKYEESFRKFLKGYLKEKNLLESDRLIEPKEMKKIFIDIMFEGTTLEEADDFTKEINEELSRIFIKKYYKKNTIIRGKDIYDLINIKEIQEKYYQLNGELPIYDDEDNGDLFNNDL